MELPIELKNIIEREIEKNNLKNLQRNAESISVKYREEPRTGKRLLTENTEALAYSAVRMPATYGAVYTALSKLLEIHNPKIETVLDVGAGTGAGIWAVNSLLGVKKNICLEREDAMRNLGKYFMQESELEELKKVEWRKFDLVNSSIEYTADLVICSYVLNELNESERESALKKLWNATNKILLIVEPGTPNGFAEIKELRNELINYGGSVIAPCPNVYKCPMPCEDWCHTTCRVARTKIHKLLKNGDVPYEDEKFSYIAVCKEKIEKKKIARVLRHPKIESGKITMQLCSEEGIQEKIVTKKEKELFKIARKLKCGDALEL